MRNIGPVSRRWLSEIEIYTLADLEQVGPIATYKMIKAMRGGKVSLNLLWALVGALEDIDCRDLPPERKTELRVLLKDSYD
ncbi:TfoX/Sxy family DNA transformation protein [Neptuniibacter sp. QD37_6]|uniref:TfoX/Sxy family DNA transformation protein n=1 Tax=Neptuniibacter sp. QD37_6 TaxID=3398210 RepID=UPI0039F5F5D7